MFGLPLVATALLTLISGFLTPEVHALPNLSRTGRYIYDESGTRFYIKGVAYQEQGAVVASTDNPFGEPSSFIDPLALPDNCNRDLPYLKQLSVNTIRVYSVNSSLNHDACMAALSGAGIYTLIDLSLPLNGSIDRTNPSWSTNLLNEYTKTIDAFSKYDNVLGYNIGNEVVTSDHIVAAPFVKAAARDIKAYLTSKGSSALVGYAAIDGSSDFRASLATYFTCDPSGKNSASTAIDMYGLNDYAWCGDSTFDAAYGQVTLDFASYNVVAYFGEFGCKNAGAVRTWQEITAMYSTNMNTVWSGGIAFSYFPAESAAGEFGIVTLSSDGKTVTTSADFDNLGAQYGNVTFIGTPSKSSAPASQYSSCPATIAGTTVSSSLPPTPNAAACTCLENTLSCQFTPSTQNYTGVVGEVITNGCGLLSQAGGSCSDITGDGGSGTYGRVSDCDPTIKASYVMSLYYEASKRNVQACSFAGNGTVNSNSPSSVSAANAASSCISNPGVFTPSPVPSSTGKSSSPSSTQSKSAAVSSHDGPYAFVGLTITVVVTLLGGLWTIIN